MNLIKYKAIYLTISGILVFASLIVVMFFGLKPGIDFTGGTLWQIRGEGITKTSFQDFLNTTLEITDATTLEQSDGALLARFKETSEADHQAYLEKARATFGSVEELSFETIGSSIGAELKQKSLKAIILVLVAISLYIAFAFRKVSYPVNSWKYGIITLVTLFHDAMIAIGFFALMGFLFGAETGVSFIVAILVVVGFSVHDTIVVFDRIRENLRTSNEKNLDFSALVNRSVNETMARSINTSLTLVLVLLALLAFQIPGLQYFILTILVGTVVGTYSSIFIASPLLTLWKK